ncbi:translocation/assembly module TamB domain-containing protein [Marinicella gelatinilytica]|uniref:translocation/assembly module TamB domain-containing protein n=1 Tax=Marinicella gelatinilytica TaxID=2996017 RepID=UPI002260B111|nr:translocation/assembly module TamB domain-containing protein [Marinicella gelatinilytica]MCX7543835.1 translocation/assembly module TamB domain-containing protein [Marinicella gelatinilytica]
MTDKDLNNAKDTKKPRFRRWIGYMLVTLFVLLGLLLMLLYGLLYTETGSRWAVAKAQDWLPLHIRQSGGRLAGEMTALNLTYQQDGVTVKVDRLTYQIADINWWQRHIVFDNVHIGQVSIELADNDAEKVTEPLPEGATIELPLSVDVNELFIQNIDINKGQIAYGPIWSKAALLKETIEIDTLQLLDEEISLKLSGEVTLHNRWPFNVNTHWSYKPEQISGQGRITGDITALNLSQQTHFSNIYAEGDAHIESQVTLYPTFLVDAHISSDQLSISSANTQQVSTRFTDVLMTADGGLTDYRLTVKATAEQSIKSLMTASEQKAEPATYYNEINLTAQGSTEQLNVDALTIAGDFGRLHAQSKINFTPNLQVTASFDTDAFNPQWLMPEWPGKLSGAGQLSLAQTNTESWQLALNNFNVQGQLKGQDLTLSADVDWQDDLLDLKPLSLLWGDNQIKLQGQVSLAEQAASQQLMFDLKIPQPHLFVAELSGDIQAKGQLSGSINALDYDVNLQAQTLNYMDQQIKTLDILGKGQWPNQLQAKITATDILSANQYLPAAELELNGNLQQHQLQGDILHQDFTTQLTLVGGWLNDQQIWRGQIEKNAIRLNDSDMQWNLQAPAKLVIGQQMHLSPACWQSLNGEGEACAELDVQTQAVTQVLAKVQLRNLQVKLFQSLLPQGLKLDGLIQGSADLNYQQQALSLTADLKTEQANIYYREGQKNSYQVAINKATLTARQDNGRTEVNTVITLDDGGYLNASATLDDIADSPWPEVNADIDGVIKHTRFLVALSPELEQLQGEFSVSGEVTGPLNQPAINLDLKQQTGFLVLRQTGSRLTNIALLVSSQKPGLIDLTANADSDTGSIEITGELDIQQADDWSYYGQISGTDFRLLTLPEIKVNIDPNLEIDATPKAVNITGKLSLPMAEVNIKNLPPSATTTSDDVVIHYPEQDTPESSTSIPINYDVTAEIKEPINIQLMGLEAKMAGQLRVFNVRKQTHAEGRLNLTEGFYKLYGQRLDIERGELIFNGPIDNPAIDVKAARKSDDGTVTAGILISGTVNQLQSTLYSEPAMSQLEILSYLATGRGLNESGGGTNGEQLAQAAILLGLKRSDSVFSQLQNAFGIDVLTIKQGTNNQDSYIEAGQNIGDDLYVGYSQGLFNRLGFWILRYKISEALRLETTQGENQTVDLIYVRRKK